MLFRITKNIHGITDVEIFNQNIDIILEKFSYDRLVVMFLEYKKKAYYSKITTEKKGTYCIIQIERLRLMHIQGRSNNRDGMALRILSEKLLIAPKQIKLLISIADGQPKATADYTVSIQVLYSFWIENSFKKCCTGNGMAFLISK